ncbi:MarR family transcriptional regulator [Prescottella agglutinans]|uniref:MarR family transcriptional regulator n=1 Tax=Prescottella agglutinans TaxID=1644129 RepID=A0A438BD41_9NOCA|nr:MarR family transcriptional regulator [Prescottella agglutinans]RVW08909.1 MarR family transcriptional regulator [Prescottella agglutinans]
MPEPTRPDDDALTIVHRVRALTIELHLIGADFASRNRLHTTDLRALICLLDADRSGVPATPGLLADELALTSASTTALVDRLERAGHIRRVRDTADRRRVLLEVTPSAVELGWSFFGPLIGAATETIDDFTPDEQGTIERFLVQMTAAAAATRDQLAP